MGICIRRWERVLVNVVMLEIHGNMTVNYVKLKGLCAGQFYKDSRTGKIYTGRGSDGSWNSDAS